jgi:hypothetical protein
MFRRVFLFGWLVADETVMEQIVVSPFIDIRVKWEG